MRVELLETLDAEPLSERAEQVFVPMRRGSAGHRRLSAGPPFPTSGGAGPYAV